MRFLWKYGNLKTENTKQNKTTKSVFQVYLHLMNAVLKEARNSFFLSLWWIFSNQYFAWKLGLISVTLHHLFNL